MGSWSRQKSVYSERYDQRETIEKDKGSSDAEGRRRK